MRATEVLQKCLGESLQTIPSPSCHLTRPTIFATFLFRLYRACAAQHCCRRKRKFLLLRGSLYHENYRLATMHMPVHRDVRDEVVMPLPNGAPVDPSLAAAHRV
jgi:hypothetical protein